MKQKTFLLLTTVGEDRPGIVEAVSGWVLDHGGNIEESRMSVLGGEFATMVLISGSQDLYEVLEKSRSKLERDHQLHVFLKPVQAKGASPEKPVIRYQLKSTSLDTAGIVNRISQLLNKEGINIVSGETKTTDAPFSGAPVFHFELVIDIPSDIPVSKLRENLNIIADEENFDIILKAVEPE